MAAANTLAEDLSDISDIKRIDLSNIPSLEGDIKVLANCPQMTELNFEGCRLITGTMDQAIIGVLCGCESLNMKGTGTQMDELTTWIMTKYEESGHRLVEIKDVPKDIKGSIDVLKLKFVGKDLKVVNFNGCKWITGDIKVLAKCPLAPHNYQQHAGNFNDMDGNVVHRNFDD